jgi:hypothetical protein
MMAQKDIDLSDLCDGSTYEALSSCVCALEKAGRPSTDLVSRKEDLDLLIQVLEERKIDLLNLSGFPYDAPDLAKCMVLLARLQNRRALKGVQYQACTVCDIIEDTLLDRRTKKHRYDIGEWVEVRGRNFIWRLEIIKDILKVKDGDDAEDTYTYVTAVDLNLTESEIRWPREALRRIFGMAPWVWQQWACLRLENKMRFQAVHPDDFELLDIRDYIHELWKCWLFDEQNKDFREFFDRVGPSGQAELVDHLMSPFDLMDEVITNRDDKWNFDDAGISIFTYMSLLGSGFLDAFAVLLLQVGMPVILLLFYTSDAEGEDGSVIGRGTRPMLFIVIFYYLFRVNKGKESSQE